MNTRAATRTPAPIAQTTPFTHPGRELFRETQPLHQNIIVRIVVPLVTVALAWAGVTAFSGTLGASRWTLLAVFSGSGALLLSLMFVRLRTVVTEDHLIISYRPFPGRRVPIESIVQADAIRYTPLSEGGWGWRISKRYHRVFNVSGNDGVYVRYGEGSADRFLVGSRDAKALGDAIAQARAARVC